ncbi:MetQ/NlpA family ABC transporter substrate-binding protein [Dokdonella sp.]|uniref:MetQ/NlpA family ABC transporter substrate-binding protein n=1 Tax=Dokdonella sp. TaxID=2291710 RepID=UPI001B05F036|nr:MetQ/NlpA family ABC transporter substrate-binding protein [Dokdonella sp.]MBO9664408.1 MetQ/NlpA family ABC transporter substrate-binding protein [Dokdonella sp.]
MKRLPALIAALAAVLVPPLAAAETLTVAATAVPHAEILEAVKPALAAEGVELKIKVFTDYVQPNVQVAEKRIDANYFQTKQYLEEFNRNRGTHLVALEDVHVEPLGLYSRKAKTLAELADGANVALPNDPSNTGRALLLLQRAKLITLKDPANPVSTLKDVATNPKNLTFRELEAATLPRVLGQVDAAVINTNYALDAKLDPSKDALAIEDADTPYVNVLVAREDNKDAPAVKKLAAALHSAAVKDFIKNKYRGAVVPAF